MTITVGIYVAICWQTDNVSDVAISSGLWPRATSGIPQGNVIGPVLLVFYINDLSDSIWHDVYLFADDTKIYSEISNVIDCVSEPTGGLEQP